jgi:hypothetical protein
LDEDIVTYDIQFEQRALEETEHIEREAESTTATSTFLLPFARFSRILE